MKETLLRNAELLHAATVSDDKQTFLKILNDCPELYGAVFGRFPLESLAVMYSARKILSAAEFPSAPKLAFREYPEDYIEFKKIAGRALRLTMVRPEGGKLMSGGAFANGYRARTPIGIRFENLPAAPTAQKRPSPQGAMPETSGPSR